MQFELIDNTTDVVLLTISVDSVAEAEQVADECAAESGMDRELEYDGIRVAPVQRTNVHIFDGFDGSFIMATTMRVTGDPERDQRAVASRFEGCFKEPAWEAYTADGRWVSSSEL